jgi:hypothetical protein
MDSDSIISRDFAMFDGGVTAYGSHGSIVGVSKGVSKQDGWLLFSRPDEDGSHGTTVSPAKVYCKLVSPQDPGSL